MSRKQRIFLIAFAFVSLMVIKYFALSGGAVTGSTATFI